jgi:hypothetical protein
MSKAAVKKKGKVLSEEELEGRAKDEVALMVEQSRVRGEMGQAAYDAQDKETQRVLDLMVKRFLLGANGIVRISPNGAKGESYAVSVSMDVLKANALWQATEILKDFALFDFQIANYEFPDVYCAACGTALKPKSSNKPLKKKKRKKKT